MKTSSGQKCVRCGFPCRVALFNTSEGCTNPDCLFFDNEVIAASRKSEDEIRKAFRLAGVTLP